MLALLGNLPAFARSLALAGVVGLVAGSAGYVKGRADGAAVAETRAMKATIEQMRQRGMINEDVRGLPDPALCRELGGLCD